MSKNISESLEKYFTKGFKETIQPFEKIPCMIAQNGLAKFSQRFEHDHDVVKKHFKNVTARFYKAFPKFFGQLSLKKPFMKYYEKHAKRFHVKISREFENVKKYFRILAKIFHERL